MNVRYLLPWLVLSCAPPTPVAGDTDVPGPIVRDTPSGPTTDTASDSDDPAPAQPARMLPGLLHLPRVTSLRSAWTGEFEEDRAGVSTSGAGDVDGDGLDDVLVGAPRWDGPTEDIGRVYVLTGAQLAQQSAGSLAEAHHTISGSLPDEHFGTRAISLGDIDGDGFSDLGVSAPLCCDDLEARFLSGRVDVISGRSVANRPASYTDLIRTDAWLGPERERTGSRLAIVGDMDGDGFPELAVGLGTTAGSQRIPVLRVSPATIPLMRDRVLVLPYLVGGGSALDAVPMSAGDVDGDGLDDLLIGLPQKRGDDEHPGSAWLLTGHTFTTVDDLDLAQVGIELVAPPGAMQVGLIVSPAGDVDGDGLDDVLVGSRHASSPEVWDLHVLLGARLRGAKQVHLADADAILTMHHVRFSPGSAPIGVGDLNGDGFGDLLLGVAEGSALRAPLDDVRWADGAVLHGGARFDLTPEGMQTVLTTPVGDVDGDGLPDVAIADWRDSTVAPNAGMVVVLAGPKR